jgi:hypothetical protein
MGDVTRDEGGRGRDATAAARLNSANRAVAAAEATGTSVLLDVWAAATGPSAAVVWECGARVGGGPSRGPTWHFSRRFLSGKGFRSILLRTF